MKMLMVKSNIKYKIYFSKMTWKTKEQRTYWGTNKMQGIVSENIENCKKLVIPSTNPILI